MGCVFGPRIISMRSSEREQASISGSSEPCSTKPDSEVTRSASQTSRWMANRTFRIAFGISVCIMGRREDIRFSGGGLAVGLVNQPNEQLPPPLPTPSVTKQKLIVGLAVDPPFVIHEPDGSWIGISVELWQQVANQIGLNYEFRETDLRGRFEGLAQGWLDATVGPLTITAQREQVCDFTHAYYVSGLGVAVLKSSTTGNENLIFNPAFFRFVWSVSKVALALLAVLAVVAILIWLCERRTNPTQFSGQGHPVRGLGASLWWAAGTMASVGYGDLVPRTLLGRTIAIIWMFVSLVLVSAFTATMASTLTAERLAGVSIRSLEDLR